MEAANPVVLATIGLPLIVGIYLRFTRFDLEVLKLAMGVTVLVFTTVGTGYCFWTAKYPTSFFVANGQVFGSIAFVIGMIGAFVVGSATAEKVGGLGSILGVWGVGVLCLFIWNLLPEKGWFLPAYFANVLLVFAAIGAIHAILGTIAAGFTLSSAIHSMVIGNGIPSMFLWKDVFEFLHVSSMPVMVVILVLISFAGSAELLVSLTKGILSGDS